MKSKQNLKKKIFLIIIGLFILFIRLESKQNKAFELLNYFNQNKSNYTKKSFGLLNDFINNNDTLKKILYSNDSIILKNLNVKIIPMFFLNENAQNFNCQDNFTDYISIFNDTSFFDASFFYKDKFLLKIFKSKNDISFEYEDYYDKFSKDLNGYFFSFENYNYFKKDCDLTFYIDGLGRFLIKDTDICKEMYFHQKIDSVNTIYAKDSVFTVNVKDIFQYYECEYFIQWIRYVGEYEHHKNDIWYKIFNWNTFNNKPEYTFQVFEFIEYQCDHPGK